MIERLEITGVHMEIPKKLHEYAIKKIGRLDRYAPRAARPAAHAEIFLKERQLKARKECTCEVVLRLPGETLTAKETTVNIYAAIDIVEAKLRNRVKKYKETHDAAGITRRLLGRMKR